MTKPWFAALNPKSGGGRAARDRTHIVHILRGAGVQFELAASQHASHAISLAREAAASGYRKFLAIGGDGTLNELLNGIRRWADLPRNGVRRLCRARPILRRRNAHRAGGGDRRWHVRRGDHRQDSESGSFC